MNFSIIILTHVISGIIYSLRRKLLYLASDPISLPYKPVLITGHTYMKEDGVIPFKGVLCICTSRNIIS